MEFVCDPVLLHHGPLWFWVCEDEATESHSISRPSLWGIAYPELTCPWQLLWRTSDGTDGDCKNGLLSSGELLYSLCSVNLQQKAAACGGLSFWEWSCAIPFLRVDGGGMVGKLLHVAKLCYSTVPGKHPSALTKPRDFLFWCTSCMGVYFGQCALPWVWHAEPHLLQHLGAKTVLSLGLNTCFSAACLPCWDMWPMLRFLYSFFCFSGGRDDAGHLY